MQSAGLHSELGCAGFPGLPVGGKATRAGREDPSLGPACPRGKLRGWSFLTQWALQYLSMAEGGEGCGLAHGATSPGLL